MFPEYEEAKANLEKGEMEKVKQFLVEDDWWSPEFIDELYAFLDEASNELRRLTKVVDNDLRLPSDSGELVDEIHNELELPLRRLAYKVDRVIRHFMDITP